MKETLTDEINRLVKTYEMPLLRYAAGIVKDTEAARDIVQETFIRYVDKRANDGAAIRYTKAWLYRVAHNLALDHLRKYKRQLELDETTQENLADHRLDTPDAAADKRDAEAAAWESLEILSDRDRQVVLLKVIDNKSYKTIAKQLNLTVTNVGFILHNSLKKLARELHDTLS